MKPYHHISELPLPFVFVRKDENGKTKLPLIRVSVRAVPSSCFPFRVLTEWDEKGNGEWKTFWATRRAKTEQSAMAKIWDISFRLNRLLSFTLINPVAKAED